MGPGKLTAKGRSPSQLSRSPKSQESQKQQPESGVDECHLAGLREQSGTGAITKLVKSMWFFVFA